MSQGSYFLTTSKIFIGCVRAQTMFYINSLIYAIARDNRNELRKSNITVWEITNQINHDAQEQVHK